jgi:hypothetical protein
MLSIVLSVIVLACIFYLININFILPVFLNHIYSRCSKLTQYDSSTIRPIEPTPPVDGDDPHGSQLSNYYIKCAYNACASGNFEDGIVEKCALEKCLKNGSRGLDFEIYSVNNEPVISCSDNKGEKSVMGTNNNLNFKSIMKYINNNAFSPTFCPSNHTDPLIINLRIHIEDDSLIEVYNKISDILASVFETKLIGRPHIQVYSGEFESVGKLPLRDCLNKVIVFVNRDQGVFAESSLRFYTNASFTGVVSPSSRLYTNSEVQSLSVADFTDYHKDGSMTMTIPDGGKYPRNISFETVHKPRGISMAFMCNQTKDVYIEEYHRYFSDSGSSFVKKSSDLLAPLTVERVVSAGYDSQPVDIVGSFNQQPAS